jgi:hypothetical protein
LKPTAVALDSAVTAAVDVRDAGNTAHDASSGSCPAGPTRTRSTSSRKADICMTLAPDRISTPFAVAREDVTRSSRTDVDFCGVCAVDFVSVAAAKISNPRTTKIKLRTRDTQHLVGAN